MKLKKRERHQRIISELHNNLTVRISVLAELFGVTTETIRRDLQELSEKGLVDRTYGGAAGSISKEPAIRMREKIMVEERTRLAQKACEFAQSGDVLMLDAGATNVHFARALATLDLELNVLTNCVSVAAVLSESPTIRVILCPGEFSNRENSVVGLETHHFLNRFHANKTITSAGGITVEGLTEFQSDATWVKRTMIERSDQTILLIDHGKFNLKLMEVICSFRHIHDIILDREPDRPLKEALRAASVEMHLVE